MRHLSMKIYIFNKFTALVLNIIKLYKLAGFVFTSIPPEIEIESRVISYKFVDVSEVY